jgi:uncharacterized cupredoxin-like copper-binding protein
VTVIRRLSLIALLAIGATAIAACGDGNADDGGGDASPTMALTEKAGHNETTVAFTLADFEVTGPSSAAAGAIRFDVKNDGKQPHELVIIRSDGAADALPVEGAIVPEAKVDFIGEVEEFAAGEERSSTFNLEAGRYLVICNIPAHYQLGMVAEFTVE